MAIVPDPEVLTAVRIKVLVAVSTSVSFKTRLRLFNPESSNTV